MPRLPDGVFSSWPLSSLLFEHLFVLAEGRAGELQITDLMLVAGMTEARKCQAMESASASNLAPLVKAIYTAMMRWRMDPKGASDISSVTPERHS